MEQESWVSKPADREEPEKTETIVNAGGDPRVTGSAVAYAAPPAPAFLSDKKDLILAILTLLGGVLIAEIVLFVGGLGIGVALMTVVAYASVMIYGATTGRAQLRCAPELYVANLLLAGSFIWLEQRSFGILRLIVLTLLSGLHFMTMFGVRTLPRYTWRGIVGDGIGGALTNSIGNVDKFFRVCKQARGERESSGIVRQVLCGVLIALPLLGVLVLLLCLADGAFDEQVTRFFELLSVRFWEHIGRVLLGLILAFCLFGYMYRLRYNNRLKLPTKPIIRALPTVTVYTVLAAVCVLYVLFLVIAGNYLFSGLSGKLPDTFFYATYARRGFFELLAVSVINMAILLITYIYTARQGERPHRVLQVLLSVLILETWLLIASALSKMVMYIGVYGLTRLRVYTSWFMVLLALVFLAALIQLWCQRFPAFKAVVIAGMAWFLLLNFSNADGLIARYNVTAYQNGTLAEIDVQMFEELSDAMVVPAAELLEDEDKQVAIAAARLLDQRKQNWSEDRFGSWNITTALAKMRYAEQQEKIQALVEEYESTHNPMWY